MSAENQHIASANTSSSRQPMAAENGVAAIRKPRMNPKPSVTAIEIT